MDEKKFNEIEYFADVARIKYLIAHLEKKHNLVSEVVIDKKYGTVNPVYGRIHADGAFGIAFSGGYPEYIYTPYGQSKIDSADHKSTDITNKLNLLREMWHTFGLVRVEPSLSDEPGEIGTRYAITRLPWKEQEKFPVTYHKMNDFLSMDEQINTLRHVDKIYNQVNTNFVEAGYPDLVIGEPKKKSKLNLATENRVELSK